MSTGAGKTPGQAAAVTICLPGPVASCRQLDPGTGRQQSATRGIPAGAGLLSTCISGAGRGSEVSRAASDAAAAEFGCIKSGGSSTSVFGATVATSQAGIAARTLGDVPGRPVVVQVALVRAEACSEKMWACEGTAVRFSGPNNTAWVVTQVTETADGERPALIVGQIVVCIGEDWHLTALASPGTRGAHPPLPPLFPVRAATRNATTRAKLVCVPFPEGAGSGAKGLQGRKVDVHPQDPGGAGSAGKVPARAGAAPLQQQQQKKARVGSSPNAGQRLGCSPQQQFARAEEQHSGRQRIAREPSASQRSVASLQQRLARANEQRLGRQRVALELSWTQGLASNLRRQLTLAKERLSAAGQDVANLHASVDRRERNDEDCVAAAAHEFQEELDRVHRMCKQLLNDRHDEFRRLETAAAAAHGRELHEDVANLHASVDRRERNDEDCVAAAAHEFQEELDRVHRMCKQLLNDRHDEFRRLETAAAAAHGRELHEAKRGGADVGDGADVANGRWPTPPGLGRNPPIKNTARGATRDPHTPKGSTAPSRGRGDRASPTRAQSGSRRLPGKGVQRLTSDHPAKKRAVPRPSLGPNGALSSSHNEEAAAGAGNTAAANSSSKLAQAARVFQRFLRGECKVKVKEGGDPAPAVRQLQLLWWSGLASDNTNSKQMLFDFAKGHQDAGFTWGVGGQRDLNQNAEGKPRGWAGHVTTLQLSRQDRAALCELRGCGCLEACTTRAANAKTCRGNLHVEEVRHFANEVQGQLNMDHPEEKFATSDNTMANNWVCVDPRHQAKKFHFLAPAVVSAVVSASLLALGLEWRAREFLNDEEISAVLVRRGDIKSCNELAIETNENRWMSPSNVMTRRQFQKHAEVAGGEAKRPLVGVDACAPLRA